MHLKMKRIIYSKNHFRYIYDGFPEPIYILYFPSRITLYNGIRTSEIIHIYIWQYITEKELKNMQEIKDLSFQSSSFRHIAHISLLYMYTFEYIPISNIIFCILVDLLLYLPSFLSFLLFVEIIYPCTELITL